MSTPVVPTLGQRMSALQAIEDAVAVDHWISYHDAVAAAKEIGITDTDILAAYDRVARRDGTPSFTVPQAFVTSWIGEDSGLTFVHCALCTWADHDMDHREMNARARSHRCQS